VRLDAEPSTDGLTTYAFTAGDVPGVAWFPPDPDVPLVLVGHGGGRHARHPAVLDRARSLVAAGFAVAAIDAPGHGGRPRVPGIEDAAAALRRLIAAGKPVGEAVTALNGLVAAAAVPEWRRVLDGLLRHVGPGTPVGYVGLSMAAAIGIPLLAAEPRIRAAVLGLLGDEAVDAAARVRVPVEFVMQWHDAQVPRHRALALFDAIGSADKTLHANPGGHGDVPAFQHAASIMFLRRHLVHRTRRAAQ
jgi:pimeloyl-ACP methyl ester carboxylesterase